MIPIETSKGSFRCGLSGLGSSDEEGAALAWRARRDPQYLEAFDSYFPAAGIEYYYYDQLGSYYSDQPDEPEVVELERFVEEVEQVRQALRLDRENFYTLRTILGRPACHRVCPEVSAASEGPNNLNMMASIPQYNEYARKGTDAWHGSGHFGGNPTLRSSRRATRTHAIWSC
jgi:proline iminopeptidase